MHLNLIKALLFAAIVALVLPVAASAAGDAAAGKATFDMNCMSCHGPMGQGDGPLSAALNPKPRNLASGDFKFDTDKEGGAGTDADLKNVIQNGAAAYGGSPLMAPWPSLSDGDLDNLVAYIRSLKK
jgi:mono/diheme cytochrome c family protein